MSLIIPPGVQCPHLGSMLVGEFMPDPDGDHALTVSCTGCQHTWNIDTAPPEVIITVGELITSGVWVRV